jgi:hypothetical protein
MSKLWPLAITLILVLVFAGCSPSHTLSFKVIIEKAPFLVTGPGNKPLPDLIIIASPDEIVPPTPVVEYSEAMIESLKSVDFDKSFVVLHLVGQIPDNGTIEEVVRKGNTVYIKLISYSVGPGNYMFENFTLPYQITSIEKEGTWGEMIHFILEVNGGDIVAQDQHYIH